MITEFCLTSDLFLQGDQGSEQSLGNQQTAVINLGVGGFMSPQTAGVYLHSHPQSQTHTPNKHMHTFSTNTPSYSVLLTTNNYKTPQDYDKH